MARGSPKKRRKSAPTEKKSSKMDRLSNLPDALLCHILSFLQTKEAIATSVLSTRWRFIWTLVPALEFVDDWPCFSQTSFTDLVNRVLALRRVQPITRFWLESYKGRCEPHQVTTWLSLALNRNIEELDLSYYFRRDTLLPRRLFTCETMSVLKLSGSIDMNLPSYVRFPSLKTLHLDALLFADDGPFRRLLSACPVIEELLVAITMDSSPSLRISAPTLKKLHVVCRASDADRLEIDAPSLEYLRLQETTVEDFLIENLDNLLETHLEICFEEDDKKNLLKLFEGIKKTRFLCMSDFTTETLVYACLDLPEFRNLVHLQLFIVTCDSYFLVEMLKRCHKLKVLHIHKGDEKTEIEWMRTRKVPRCLSTHLTEFTLRQYQGTKDELKLATYILKSAKVLESMTVHFPSWLRPENFLRLWTELSTLPRASKKCQLSLEFM